MLPPAGHEIDAGRLDGGMSQHIRQPGNVPASPVKGGCKQMAKIVGEYLTGGHTRIFAELLHLRPDLPTAQTFSALRAEYFAGGDFFMPSVFQ